MQDQTKGPQQLALEQPFDTQVLESVDKGGRSLTYVPVAEVVSRLNAVLGSAGWSWELREVRRDSLDPDWVVAWGNLTCTIDGQTSTKSGAGGVSVSRTRKDNSIVDLGDEFKGADSDAMKKAAQRFGVGIDLARTAEARNYEMKRLNERDPLREGWETAERANQFIADLEARVKASSAPIRKLMAERRKEVVPNWPPTAEQWGVLDAFLKECIAEEQQREQEQLASPEFVAEAAAPYLSENPATPEQIAQPAASSLDDRSRRPLPLPGSPESPRELESGSGASTTPSGPEAAAEQPQQPDDLAAARKVAAAFPGSENVTPASPDHVAAINQHLQRLKEVGEQGAIRAWNKFAKEEGFPKDKTAYTEPQANRALDFIESL